MKRLFPPFLNPDVLSQPDPEVPPRFLASRQVSSDRTQSRRQGSLRKGAGGSKAANGPGLGMFSLILAFFLISGSLAVAAGAGVAASESSAAEDRTVFSLVPAPLVDGEGIFLDQVVATAPARPLPHVRLAPAPTVGQVTALTRNQVIEWIQSRAPAVLSTNWSGPERAKVTRRTRSLEETELRDTLKDVLQREYVKDRGELELRLTRPWVTALVADEPLTLKVVDLPATGVSANFIVRFELLAGSERLGSWQLAASAKVWREILVAQAPIKRGQLLRGAPVTRERRDVLTLRDTGIGIDGDEPGVEFQESLAAGQPVLLRSLRLRPVVHRGNIVDGLIFDGPMQIKLKVEILEDGLPGHVIRVRNPRTRREMLGKVQNEQTVVIPM